MQHLTKFFKKNSIIPAIVDLNEADAAMQTEAAVVFLLTGSIFNLEELMKKAREHDKLLIINLDMVEGVGKDKQGIKFLAMHELCDGIISTRRNLIQAAKDEGLITIQRVFLLDSSSFRTAMNLFNKSKPDAVELLPAVAAPYFIENLEGLSMPIIAGGLVQKKEEVDHLIKHGVLAISTSRQELWMK